MSKAKIKVDDTVLVTRGSEEIKNKTGRVISVDRAKNRVRIEGLRIITKSAKISESNKENFLNYEGFISLSNVKKV